MMPKDIFTAIQLEERFAHEGSPVAVDNYDFVDQMLSLGQIVPVRSFRRSGVCRFKYNWRNK